MARYHVQIHHDETPIRLFRSDLLEFLTTSTPHKTPDQRFGVSSPLWDLVFGTQPGRRLG